jgi:hypothetical protein
MNCFTALLSLKISLIYIFLKKNFFNQIRIYFKLILRFNWVYLNFHNRDHKRVRLDNNSNQSS